MEHQRIASPLSCPPSEPTKKLKDPHVEIKTSHLKLTRLNQEPGFRWRRLGAPGESSHRRCWTPRGSWGTHVPAGRQVPKRKVAEGPSLLLTVLASSSNSLLSQPTSIAGNCYNPPPTALPASLPYFCFLPVFIITITNALFKFWLLSTPSLFPAATPAAKSLQSCPTLCDPRDGSPPGSPSLGFSRQEHWSGLPFPSPMHENEKWKWSRSVVSDS